MQPLAIPSASRDALFAVPDVQTIHPWWPYSTWATWRLIRQGWLSHVRIGRRVYLTGDLLRAFVADHTVVAERCGTAAPTEQSAPTAPTTATERAAQRWGVNPDGQDGAP